MLQAELLEDRVLLASDFSPYHNWAVPTDVNADGRTQALDALLVINELNAGGSRYLGGQSPTAAGAAAEGEAARFAFVDVNGDDFLTPLDALTVINRLNAEPQGTRVQYSIEVLDVSGGSLFNPATGRFEINRGEDFLLRSHVLDVQASPTGVFSGTLDVDYDNPAIISSVFGETQTLTLGNNTLEDNPGNPAERSFYTVSYNGSAPAQVFVGTAVDGAADLQAALESLPGINPGDVKVVQRPVADPEFPDNAINRNYDITFLGDLRGTPQPEIVIDGSNLQITKDPRIRTTVNGDSANEVQQIILLGSPTGGTFTLTLDGQTTAPIAFDATGPQVETALEALSNIGAGNVSVSGASKGPWTIEFVGALAKTNVNPLTADGSGLTPAALDPAVLQVADGFTGPNEQQQIVMLGEPTGGTFTLSFALGGVQTTAPIAYDATPAVVQQRLEALGNIGAGNVSVTRRPSDPANVWRVEFIGDLAATNTPQLSSNGANIIVGPSASVVETHPADITNPGTFRSTFEAGPLYPNGLTAESGDRADGVNVTEVRAGAAGLDEIQLVSFDPSYTTGIFTLSFLGSETSTFNQDTPAADMQAALEALPTIGAGNVQVALAAPHTWTVQFTGALGQQNVDMLVPSQLIVNPNVFSEAGAADGLSADPAMLVGAGGPAPILWQTMLHADDGGIVTFTPNAPDDVHINTGPGDPEPTGNSVTLLFGGTNPEVPIADINFGDAVTLFIIEPISAFPDVFTNGGSVDEDSLNNPLDVLANDALIQGSLGQKDIDPNGFSGVTPGATVQRGVDGLGNPIVLYSPAPDFFGQDTFTYTAIDGLGNSDTALATVTVNPINDAPVLTPGGPTTTTDEETQVTLALADFINSNPPPPATDTTITDADPGDPVGGIAITGAVGNGMFEYSLNGGPFTQLLAPPTPAAALLLPAGASIRYTPDHLNGETASITYRGWDQTSGAPGGTADTTTNGGATAFSAAADTASLIVTPVNDPPVAQNVTVATTEDAQKDGNFDADDVDNDNNPGNLVYSIVTDLPAGQGTVVNNNDGSFTFHPGADFQDMVAGQQQQVQFTYKATDVHGADSNVATVTVTVTGLNDAPIAQNVAVTTTEDAAKNGAFNADDTDNDNDPTNLVYSIVTDLPAGQGTVVNNNDGTFSFDPGADFQHLSDGAQQQVQFTYKATDVHTADSNIATVTITVTGLNDAPAAQDVAVSTSEDAPVDGGFDADDIDDDNDPTNLVYSIVTDLPPGQGTVVNNNDGTFTFHPGADFQDLNDGDLPQVQFTYKATDVHTLDSNIATVTITVSGVNDAPTVQAVNVGANEDGPAVDGDFNGTDVDDDDATLTYSIVNPPVQGVTNNNDGTFTFDPGGQFENLALNQTQDVVFQYQAADPHSATSSPASATVTVTGQNDNPTASDFLVVNSNQGPGVHDYVADDIDSDNDRTDLTYQLGPLTPNKGLVSDNGDGTFTFDPNGDFDALVAPNFEDVTFTFEAIDRHGASAGVKTATVRVVPNNPPDAKDDGGFATAADTPLNVAAPGVLADNGNGADSDIENDPFTVTANQDPSTLGAAVNVSADGSFSYDPTNAAALIALSLGEPANDTFTYTITDTPGGQDTATVTVQVTGVNEAPTAAPVNVGAAEDGPPVNGAFAGDDVDNDDNVGSLTYTILTQPAEGGVVNNNDGTFTFDPGADFQDLNQGQQRVVAFDYKATDSHNTDSLAGTVTVTVTGTNDIPTAAGVAVNAVEDGPTVDGNFAGDDADSEDNAATLDYAILNQPAEGSVVNNNDGTFTFNPGADFQDLNQGQQRVVTFDYKATDLRGADSAPATVTVTVTGTNDGPTAAGVAVNAVEDGPTVDGNFAGDDADSEDNAATLDYTILNQPAQGSVVNNNDGTFTFDPGADFQQLAENEPTNVTFDYKATDARGADSAAAAVTVTVTGRNDDPIAQPVAIGAVQDGPPVNGGFDADDIDSDDNPATLTYEILSQPAEGGVQNNNDGTFTFDPGADFQDLGLGQTRDVTFTYRAADSHNAQSNVETVTVTVTGVNAAPTAVNDHFIILKDAGPQDVDPREGDLKGPASEDGQSLAIAAFSAPTVVRVDAGPNDPGQLVRNGDVLQYTPAAGFEGLVQFTYTVQDDGVPAKTSNEATVELEVLNFVPNVVKGYVFLDGDNDGVRGSEHGIGGAEVHLAGVDSFGRQIDVTTRTDMDGFYMFDQDQFGNPLPPSPLYTVTAMQPNGTRDGQEQVVTPGTPNPGLDQFYAVADPNANDTFLVTIGRLGGAQVQLNFGERGYDATQFDPTVNPGVIMDFLSSTPADGFDMVANPVYDGQGNVLRYDVAWYSIRSGWINLAPLQIQFAADLATAQLTMQHGDDPPMSPVTLSRGANQFRAARLIGGGYAVRVNLSEDEFTALWNQQASAAGEGEAAPADAAMEGQSLDMLAAAQSAGAYRRYAEAVDAVLTNAFGIEA